MHFQPPPTQTKIILYWQIICIVNKHFILQAYCINTINMNKYDENICSNK